MTDVNSFLEHHGVKGMKWGVKKRTNKENKVRAKRAKISTNRRHLSDSDLKNYIDRLSNEKKLKSLIDEDIRPGKTVTKRILSESGQKVAKTVLAGAALYGVKAAVEKKFSASDAVNYIAPRPKK